MVEWSQERIAEIFEMGADLISHTGRVDMYLKLLQGTPADINMALEAPPPLQAIGEGEHVWVRHGLP